MGVWMAAVMEVCWTPRKARSLTLVLRSLSGHLGSYQSLMGTLRGAAMEPSGWIWIVRSARGVSRTAAGTTLCQMVVVTGVEMEASGSLEPSRSGTAVSSDS